MAISSNSTDSTDSTASHLHAPVAGPVVVLHMDAQLVVLDKPAGLPVTPERTAGDSPHTPPDTLTNRLWHRLTTGDPQADPQTVKPLIVHRLDRDVSGVIVYARTADAHRDLSLQFEAHTVLKTYWGWVTGQLEPAAGQIDVPVGPLLKPNHRTRGRIFADHPGAKPAHTAYRTRECFAAHSWVELQPSTGRRHQLRVHLAHRQHPLIGDPVYAKNMPGAQWPAELVAAGHAPRVALHALRLAVRHPGTGQPFECSAPLPVDLEALLSLLRRLPQPYGTAGKAAAK